MEKSRMNPRVSIGMPVYNGAKYLEETLDTVLSQTFSDFALYISDNASTDNTEEICRDYAGRDERIVYSRNAVNVGAAGNYELCFAPATSEYFRWQNADDPIEPTLIEKCLDILDRHPDVVLAYGKSHIIDKNGLFVEAYDDNLALMQETPAERYLACLENIGLQNLMYGLIRRDALAATARMQAFVSADINLIAELTMYGKFYEIQEHLFNCRRHEDCSSWDMTDKEKLREFWSPDKDRLRLQIWRQFFEFFKGVCRSPITFSQKLKIYYILLKYVNYRKNLLGRELISVFKAT